LGDMLELGEQSELEHQAIVDLLISKNLTHVKLVGEQFCKTKNAFDCFKTVDDLIIELSNHKINDYYILIKGSRGIKLEKLIPIL